MPSISCPSLIQETLLRCPGSYNFCAMLSPVKQVAFVVCVCLMGLTRSEQEIKYRLFEAPQPMNTNHNNAWMVVAIIFILLFALTTGLNIYLCNMRRKRMQEIYDAQHQYMAKMRQQDYLSQRSGLEGRHYM